MEPPAPPTLASAFSVLWASLPLSAQVHDLSPPPGRSVEVRLPQPGNVLVLLADDLGADQLAAYGPGTDLPPTPNLDRLAAEGVLFRNAWSQPLCSPTRATIQTGRYGFRTTLGTVIIPHPNEPGLPLEELTLPEVLDLGTGGRYAHALFGKWHLGTSQVGGDLAPNRAGYHHFAGSVEGQIGSYFSWRKVTDGVVSTSTRYATSACVDDALGWIRGQQGRWLCVVAFQAPHAPFHAPPAALHTQSLPGYVPPANCGLPGGDPRPFYKAMVEALDTEIGRLLDGIPPQELARTTVLFLGDNGVDACLTVPPYSYPAKGSLYQGGVHVPLIAAGYRVERPGTCLSLVNTTDLFATVAELAGVELATVVRERELDSVSFVPCLVNPGARVRGWLYAEMFTPNGEGNPRPLPGCPALPVCQEDIGFDGPGTVALESCGAPLYGLYGFNLVPWRVTGGPPLADASLRIGPFAPAYSPTLGAWLVSDRPDVELPFVLGPAGTLDSVLWTASVSSELHYQFVVRDAGQPLGFAVSNAVRMELLWTDMQAVRNTRFKLIRSNPCRDELYDLVEDPAELTDLLLRPLEADELVAYEALSARLDALR